MSESSPSTIIAQGTLAASVLSASITAVYGVLKGKGRAVPILAGSAALNTAIGAGVFFTLRECVISPALESTSAKSAYQGNQENPQFSTSDKLSWTQLRSHKLFDTTLSGILTGGFLNAIKSGQRAIIPGAATAGIFCALLQLGYNETSVARLKYIYRRSGEPDEASPALPEPSQPAIDRLVESIGFNRISNEQYIAAMKKTRDSYLRRIRELEEQTERDKPDSIH